MLTGTVKRSIYRVTTCKKVTNAGEGVSVSVATILGKPTMYVVCVLLLLLLLLLVLHALLSFVDVIMCLFSRRYFEIGCVRR